MTRGRARLATEAEKEKYAHFLSEGEEIVAVYAIGEKYFWINFSGLILLSFFLLGLPFLLRLVKLWHGRRYILTDRRVLVKEGILSVKITTVPYDKITHISVREDFFKKVSYGIGDITIHTAGPTPVEVDLEKIEHPLRVKNLIEELIVRERSLLGTVS